MVAIYNGKTSKEIGENYPTIDEKEKSG